MKSIHRFVEGDTGSALQVTCVEDGEETPIDLTNKTVYLRFNVDYGTTASQLMTILAPASGTVQYLFQAGELVKGTLYASVRIVDNIDSTFVTQLDPFAYRVRAPFI